jgi:hypothetical protein
MNKHTAALLRGARSNWGGDASQANQFIGVPRQGNMAPMSNRANVTTEIDPISITIQNTDTTNTLYAPIFNGYSKWAIPYGSSTTDVNGTVPQANKGIVITYTGNYSAQRLIQDANASPFTLEQWYYQFNTDAQLALTWQMQNIVGTASSMDTLQPVIFRPQSNNVLTDMAFRWFQMVNGGYTLFVPVLPSSSITLIVQKQSQFNGSDALKATPAVQVYDTAKPQQLY